jgi:hypothetical protein
MTERKAPEQPPLFECVEPKPLPPVPEEYVPYLTPRQDDEEDDDE